MDNRRNVFLIIIDQLRSDYVHYLRNCRQILDQSAVCCCNSIPTSTEAMHANISTGTYPKEHGLVSKVTGGGAKMGIEQFLDSFDLSTVTSIAYQTGYDVNVIGGKSDVVAIMSFNPTYCSIGLILSMRTKTLGINHFGRKTDLTSYIWRKYAGTDRYQSIDDCILKIWEDAQSKLPKKNQFWIVTLPLLDYIGHRYGPGSSEANNHVKYLDSEISKILTKNNAGTILTGDHGCRRVGKYIVEAFIDNPIQSILYKENHNAVTFEEELNLRSKGILDVQYDGGILRVKLKPNSELNSMDKKLLSRFGCVIPYGMNVLCMNSKTKRMYRNSINENLYDVLVVADNDVTFCKSNWISVATLRNVRKHHQLEIGDLPVGEHGTYHAQDNNVLALSNCSFCHSRIHNVQLKDMISPLLI
jgi:hypothetical protein